MSHGGWNIGNHCVHSVSACSQYVLFTVSIQALKVHRRQTCDNVALTHSPRGVSPSHSLTHTHTHTHMAAFPIERCIKPLTVFTGAQRLMRLDVWEAEKAQPFAREALSDWQPAVRQSGRDGVIAKDFLFLFVSHPPLHQAVTNTTLTSHSVSGK